MSGLDLERLVLSGGPLGLMQAAFDYAGNNVSLPNLTHTDIRKLNMFMIESNSDSLSGLSNLCKEKLQICTPSSKQVALMYTLLRALAIRDIFLGVLVPFLFESTCFRSHPSHDRIVLGLFCIRQRRPLRLPLRACSALEATDISMVSCCPCSSLYRHSTVLTFASL